jgi:predicted sulfurtransferase
MLALFTFIGSALADESEFPNRKIFPNLDYIELADFKNVFSNVVVVDVRSPYEFQTIHIKDSINISRGKLDFVSKMKQLRLDNGTKKIVLYCNGRTCEQSYLAGQKCKDNHIPMCWFMMAVFLNLLKLTRILLY